jgi:hypothetical protein
VENLEFPSVITPVNHTGTSSTALAVTPGSDITGRSPQVNFLDSLAPSNPQYQAILTKLQNDLVIDRVAYQVQELTNVNVGIQQSIHTLESQLSDVASSNTSKWEHLSSQLAAQEYQRETQREQDRIDRLEQETKAEQKAQQQREQDRTDRERAEARMLESMKAMLGPKPQIPPTTPQEMPIPSDAVTTQQLYEAIAQAQLQKLPDFLQQPTSTAPSTIMLTATQELSSLTTDGPSQCKRNLDESETNSEPKKTKAVPIPSLDPVCAPLPDDDEPELGEFDAMEEEASESNIAPPEPPPLPPLPPSVPAGDLQNLISWEDATRGDES